MDKESIVEQIVRSLSFEVEALQQDTAVNVSSTSKSTPLNLKIKVRKKENAAIEDGFISVPKVDQPDSMPDRIRLVSSDQTLMSFDVLMETDLAQKPLRKPRKHIFDILRPGVCLGTKSDDDHYSYMPKSEDNNSSQSDGVMKQNLALYKINDNNTGASPSHSYRHKTFFGKCKPGGCLDPPFNENKYSYEPATIKHVMSPKNNLSKTKDLVYKNGLCSDKHGNSLKKKNRSIDSSLQQKIISKQEMSVDSILSLYQAESIRTSTTYSNSIITYPPAVTSSELRIYGSKNEKNRVSSEDKCRKSINEVADSYYTPPKKVINHLNPSGEDNISYTDQNRLSAKEENTSTNQNMRHFQSKSSDLFLKNQRSTELNSKASDSFEKNLEPLQVEVPELFLKHQEDYEIKSKNTDPFGKEHKFESVTYIEIKPKYIQPSQIETMQKVSSRHLNIPCSDLKQANNDQSIYKTYPKVKSEEILLQIKSTDSQPYQYDQENRKTEQNETHKVKLSITSSLSDHLQALTFRPKTDNLSYTEGNESTSLLEEAVEKKDVTNENENLPINRNLDEITNIDIHIESVKKLSYVSPKESEETNKSVANEKPCINTSDDSQAGGTYLEMKELSPKTSTADDSNCHSDIYEEYDKSNESKEITLSEQEQSKISGSPIIEAKIMESDTVMEFTQISTEKDELDNLDSAKTLQPNVLDNLAKNEKQDDLLNSKEIKKIYDGHTSFETAILMQKTPLHGSNESAKYYGLSKDIISNNSDIDKPGTLNDSQALRSGPHMITENKYLQITDYKKENEEFELDRSNKMDISPVDINLKDSNIQDKLYFNLPDIKIRKSLIDTVNNEQLFHTIYDSNADPSNQDKENFIPADIGSLKINALETPYLSKNFKKTPDECVDDNSIKQSFQTDFEKKNINKENEKFTRKDERISSDITPIRTEAKISGITIDTRELEANGSKILPGETLTSLQLQMPNKNILKKDTISVEVDLAFQSYLTGNNERVLKSINSASVPERSPRDSIIIVKCQIRTSCSNEIKVPLDSDNDLLIQIKQSNIASRRESELENIRYERKKKLATGANVSISGKELEVENKNNTETNNYTTKISDITLQDNLVAMYEQELLPLQILIKGLKEEIDILGKQKTIINDKLRSLKTANTMRLIKVSKKCGCLRK